jgi:hypothetical protein
MMVSDSPTIHKANVKALTVADLAKAKRLLQAFLRELGLTDLPQGGVAIPYSGPTGEEIAIKRRTAVKARDGSYWPKGKPLAAYGQWRLDTATKAGILILVEGESDCWALWKHGLPALGLPGASTVKTLLPEHVEALQTVYVHREPDNGGTAFLAAVVKRLPAVGFAGKAFEMRMPDGVKDPADLHAQDPSTFKDRLKEAILKAAPIGAVESKPADGHADLDCELGTLLSTVNPEQVSWLWPGRIPLGKLTILDGDPGLGKSVLTLTLAAMVTAGQSMPFAEREPGVDPDPAGVVLLSAEDGLDDTIRPRLDAAGADVERVLALDRIPDRNHDRLPVLPADVGYIRMAIRRVGAKLVVIDPLTAFLGSDTNAHKDQDCRRALHPLAVVAQETGAAVVVVRHLNKAAGGSPLYRGGGSIGIIGAARSGLLVARDPDNPDRRVLASTKSNLARLPASIAFDLSTAGNGALRIGWIGPSPHTAESLLAAPRDDEDRDAVAEALDVLRTILDGGSRPANDVKREARKAGVSERTLARAKTLLGVRAIRLGYGCAGQWHWSLPCWEDAAAPKGCQAV